MSAAEILVLNPNNVEAVTRRIDSALAHFRFPQGPVIHCATLPDGPPVIATQADVDGLTPAIGRYVRQARQARRIDAVVVACFADPGVQALRETSDIPVYGIAESAYLASVSLGERLGVVSMLGGSVARHARQIRALGLSYRLAADLALDLPAQSLDDPQQRDARLVEVGSLLRDRHGADVIILGCAGLSEVRKPLQSALGVRVIDPVQAAVAQALGALLPDQ